MATHKLSVETGADGAVGVLANGLELLRYQVAAPTDPKESPRPFFHPLRTLRGNEVTCFRPHDHPWHRGLSMTSAFISGHNFWGGPSFVRGEGYVWDDNHGQVRHLAWAEQVAEDSSAFLAERLEWVGSDGARLLTEQRGIGLALSSRQPDCYGLDLSFHFLNVHSEPLIFGSPTTEGRPDAGYGGLFWRGPRSFLGGQIIAPEGRGGPEMMGQRAPWLAFTGRHDGTCDSSTLIFIDHPENPDHPTRWFVRNDPYGCVAANPAFGDYLVLHHGTGLGLRYRLVVAHGAWTPEQVEAYLAETNLLSDW